MRQTLRNAAASATALVLLLSACMADPDREAARSLADGSAQAQLQAYFDRHPQCGRVLTATTPLGFYGPEADALPGERLFFDLGFLRRTPKPADPELAGFDYFAEPTPEAASMFRIDRDGYRPELTLCYGRRQVTGVWLDGPPGSPNLRYRYRLVDRAPWTLRPDVRALYPFLDVAFSREIEAQDALISWEKGRWDPQIIDPFLRLGGDWVEWFGYCPPKGYPRPPECAGFR